MSRRQLVRTHHGNSDSIQHTSTRRGPRGGESEALAGPTRAVFARMMDEHYYSDLLEHARPRYILVECTSRYPAKRHFRCYVGDSQAQVLRTMDSPLTCSFSLGKAGWRGTLRRCGRPLGTLRRAGADHFFEVNGNVLMKLRIGSGSSEDSFCSYRVQLGDQVFDQKTPSWSRRQRHHLLKYDLLNTKKHGIASCKNFRMDKDGESVLEYVRLDRLQMLVAVAPPFNAFIGAVAGISRFRG